VISTVSHGESVPVKGEVKVIRGNQMPIIQSHEKAKTLSVDYEVVAVEGKVASWNTVLDEKQLKKKILGKTRTINGNFTLYLPVNTRATLLLKVANGYYLNSFDGAGNYTSFVVERGMKSLTLTDDQQSLQ
jgi:hypothetical protein